MVRNAEGWPAMNWVALPTCQASLEGSFSSQDYFCSDLQGFTGVTMNSHHARISGWLVNGSSVFPQRNIVAAVTFG